MGQFPYFHFYVDDWLSSPKVTMMTPAQEAAYLRLLCYAWNDPTCSIPDDDHTLAALTRLNEHWFNGGSTVVKRCFIPKPGHPGRLYNPRLQREWNKRVTRSEASKQAGIQSGVARRHQRTTVQHMLNNKETRDTEKEKSPPRTPPLKERETEKKESTSLVHRTPLDERFDTFWHSYPRKIGKGAARRVWTRIKPSPTLLTTILNAIDTSQLSEQWQQEHGRYIPNPATWLNQERWEDEHDHEHQDDVAAFNKRLGIPSR